jgi:hypothetical protein
MRDSGSQWSMQVAEKLDWKGLKIKKKRREQENHNVGPGPI